jgi:hypothetical protein
MIFGISMKNYMDEVTFHQKIFFTKIRPVGDHRAKLSIKVLRGSTVEFFVKNIF